MNLLSMNKSGYIAIMSVSAATALIAVIFVGLCVSGSKPFED
jgi:hypothetical protein